MLGKLFKYECRATGRILMPVYGAAILMSIISALFMQFMPSSQVNHNVLITVAAILSVVLFFSLIAVAVGLSFVFSIFRFKRNILGQEGYLMNTLPVGTWQNISAKLITAVLFQLLSLIVSAIAGFVFAYISSRLAFQQVFNDIRGAAAFWLNQMTPEMWTAIFQFCLLILLGAINMNVMIYAAMSVGHSAASGKVIKSIGVYITFYIVSQLLSVSVLKPVIGMNLGMSTSGYMSNTLFMTLIIIQAFYIVAYFAITNYFIKNKLNLQ